MRPVGERRKKETIKYNHRYCRHRLNYLSSDHWRGLYPRIYQRFWPTHWCCLRWTWGSSFPFNSRHTKIFQGPNGEARKTQCHYAACPKQVRQHSWYYFTGSARRGHLPTEFHKVLQEREKYKFKTDIRNQTKAKVKQIKKEREEILEQGRKEGKEIFLWQIANSSGTQGVHAI